MKYRLEMVDGRLRQVPVEEAATRVQTSVPEQAQEPQEVEEVTEDPVEADTPIVVEVPEEKLNNKTAVTAANARALQRLFEEGGPRPWEPLLESLTARQLAAAMAYVRWRESRGQLRSSRCAMAARLASCDSVTARKILHAWHIAGIHRHVLPRMSRFVSLLFLPSNTVARFAAQPALLRLAADLGSTPEELFACPFTTRSIEGLSDATAADLVENVGAAWADLSEARALLLIRGHGEGAGSWSLRAASFYVDEVSHQLVAGGLQQFEDGQSVRHVRMVEYFGPGSRLMTTHNSSLKAPPWTATTIQAGLDMAFAIELAASTREGAQAVLDWPRVWLGFAADDDDSTFIVEHGDGLVRDAYRRVKTWLARGCPDQPAFLTHLRQHPTLRPDSPPEDWKALAACLGKVEAEALLAATWLESMVKHDGLTFLPLDYFRPGSPQKPLSPPRCRRVLLSFGSRLMGREIFTPAGSTLDPLQARAQVLALPRAMQMREALRGTSPGVRWDFRTRNDMGR